MSEIYLSVQQELRRQVIFRLIGEYGFHLDENTPGVADLTEAADDIISYITGKKATS